MALSRIFHLCLAEHSSQEGQSWSTGKESNLCHEKKPNIIIPLYYSVKSEGLKQLQYKRCIMFADGWQK